MQKSYSELVEFAKSRLTALVKMVNPIDVPVVEQKMADLLECLDELYERGGQGPKPNPHSFGGGVVFKQSLDRVARKQTIPQSVR